MEFLKFLDWTSLTKIKLTCHICKSPIYGIFNHYTVFIRDVLNGTDWMCEEIGVSSWQPMWDWVQKADYMGSLYHIDEWGINVSIIYNKYAIIIFYFQTNMSSVSLGVSSKDPNLPITFHSYGDLSVTGFIFPGFDSNYVSADSDFNLPPGCNNPKPSKAPKHTFIDHLFDVTLMAKKTPKNGNNIAREKRSKILLKQKMMKMHHF